MQDNNLHLVTIENTDPISIHSKCEEEITENMKAEIYQVIFKLDLSYSTVLNICRNFINEITETTFSLNYFSLKETFEFLQFHLSRAKYFTSTEEEIIFGYDSDRKIRVDKLTLTIN